MSSSPPRPFLKVSGQNRGGPPSTSSVSTSRHVVPSTQPRCSPSRRGKLYPSSQVEESPSTVTSGLDKLALRILLCHDESTGARLDHPWAFHSITRHCARHSKWAPTHPRVAHALWSVPSRRGTSGAGHTPQATPSHRGTRPPSQVEESTP